MALPREASIVISPHNARVEHAAEADRVVQPRQIGTSGQLRQSALQVLQGALRRK